jgi:hypothetical protein
MSTNRLLALWPNGPGDGNREAPNGGQLGTLLSPVIANAEDAIAHHPGLSLTLAAALGAAIGWFVKRA